MTFATQAERCKFRSTVYGMLALAFSAPRASPGELYSGILNAHSSLSSLGHQAIGGTDPGDSAVVGLEREHLRLFVGPGRVQCPPYESSHRKDRPDFEKGLVMGPSAADVRRKYAEAGVEFSKEFTDLPDHVAVEMDFMHYLCNEESRLLQQGDLSEAEHQRNMQREFFNAHLQPWVESFADCVLKSTKSDFYRAAASLMNAFMKYEADYLFGSVDP